MDVKEIAKSQPESLISRAYYFAEKAHIKQKRASGEPYFEHVKKTANLLNDWHMDEETIVAGLLHDVVEDTGVPLEKISEEFGPAVAFLVDGVTKLGKIKYRGAESQKENIKKLVLASSEDIRVLLIKLADRYHNISTLKYLPEDKQSRIALETSDIYASLAYRLGMQHISGELEDLAFPYISPDGYHWLIENVKEKYEDREKYLTRIKPIVVEALQDANIKALHIDFRAKRYSSLYKKLLRYDMDIEKVHDLIAFRIIVESVSDCYAVLGIIHNLWPPLPGRFKDYIAMPKPNGYKSLHTVVFCVNQKIVEFQIRTQEMHDEAENGIAAHWAYEEAKGTKKYAERESSVAKEKEIEWVKRLRAWQKDMDNDSENFIDAMKIDFFKDRIFSVTPKGEVIDLPAGATPVDFAYQIHTGLGNQCIGAKVNGKIVPLNHELRSSDVVEIISQKGKKPSVTWLDFVKTTHAKNCIKKIFNKGGILGTQKPQHAEFRIIALDRIGLIKDISAIISRSHISIISLNSNAESQGKSEMHSIRIACDISDQKKVVKLMLKLKSIKEIKEIEYRFRD